MTYSDFIATLALVVAVFGAIPGIISLMTLYERTKAKIRIDVTYPMFENSPPGRLFLTVSVTPGAKPIRITSVEVAGSGLACIKPFSGTKEDASGMSTSAPTPDGPLAVAWVTPAREVSLASLSAILLMSNLSKSSLSTIQPTVKWEIESAMRLRYTHKITIPIVLITANKDRIKSPHAEAFI